MRFEELARTDVVTRLGVVPVWRKADAEASTSKPLVFAIQGLLGGEHHLAGLPGMMGRAADVAVVRIPGAEGPALSQDSFEAVAQALSEVVATRFADRPVVLAGVSAGALLAMAIRAPSVRRIVAVEPPLRTAGLWPLERAVRTQLAALSPKEPVHALWRTYFGMTATATSGRDYLHLVDQLEVPTDVLLADSPLSPPRQLENFPSLVDEAARARLAASPRVRLHQAPDTGHNVLGSTPRVVRDLLLEACARACARTVYEPRELDEPLVEATPVTARRVLHWGPGGRAFAGAVLSWNPTGEVELLGEDPAAALEPGPPFEAIALGAAPPPALLARLSERLAEGGCLSARWRAPQALAPSDRQALADLGLALREPVDLGGTGVLRAQKLAPGASPRPALWVETVAMAAFLMDVRTRLPVRGLRTDPDLAVSFTGPPYTPVQPTERPKILILQRPGPRSLDEGRRMMAHAMARGWVVVIEYDDHPGLVAEALGREPTSDHFDRFGYAHAIQTSTAPLRDFFANYVPEVRIFENSVFELAPFPPQERPLKVFYGAVTRGAFGVAVARALEPAIARFPQAQFVVLGDPDVFDALPTDNKVYEPYLPYEAYLARMAECAVSLSPIEALPMREAKSDAKFLDAARAGVLTIASPLIYEATIRHGENGLIAKGLEDWAPLLTRALEDAPYRRAMARAAWEEVRDGRMFAAQIPQRRDWYVSLWARREALFASALSRIPGLDAALAAEHAALAAPR